MLALNLRILPTEVIGIICSFADFRTHTAIRSTCSAVRAYVPRPKVVGFEELKTLAICCKFDRCYHYYKNREKLRIFQDRIHLDLDPKKLTMEQVKYLDSKWLYYELSRIARAALEDPKAFKDIDLLFKDCSFLSAAAVTGDLELLTRLLLIPNMDLSSEDNLAIGRAAEYGQLEIVDYLIQDSKVDPSSNNNLAIRWAAQNGNLLVVQRLLQDERVDPSAEGNATIREAAENGHLTVVQCLLQDTRVDPSARDNGAIRQAAIYGHLAVVQCLLQDSRVDPSANDNYAFGRAARYGHFSICSLLLSDPRVLDNYRAHPFNLPDEVIVLVPPAKAIDAPPSGSKSDRRTRADNRLKR